MKEKASPSLVLGTSGRSWPRELVGGKGASLFWMTTAGAPVPPFFVVTTEAWRQWSRTRSLSDELVADIRAAVNQLEESTGQRFGTGPDPLLVSVRSSGPVSMPGMMDTVLNLGLTPNALGALYSESGDLRFVNSVISGYVATAPDLWDDVRAQDPSDAEALLLQAIGHVFASADNERATMYRDLRNIPADLGTAAVVQTMVFGNRSSQSGTGVLFTRNPMSGSSDPVGEWMPCAQGEAIVSGRVTPEPLDELGRTDPSAHKQLIELGRQLESVDKYPQDIEFTIDGGRLFLLQTRRLKAPPLASCRTTIELYEQGLLTQEEAWQRLCDLDLDSLVTERVEVEDPDAWRLAAGLPAAPGVVRGIAVQEVNEAIRMADTGQPVVLVRTETSPHDLPGMRKAVAIVTERGGMTSHAAIVARELGVPCVVGCGQLDQIAKGDHVTVDGSKGMVYEGWIDVRREVPPYLAKALALRDSMETGDRAVKGS